ncbi:MAG: hypothetical protein M1816_006000 [Peltula sp. TS41687]|nr:MAG: hypothetical protein M1816_006000 [Peltula sp. TS41687]
MALSKSRRILILLAIDTVFFLVEITCGYAVHSLALVADSFHMLNDVLSLCVGLWAVKVAHQKPSSSSFTYGWQRAETLGALVNGVFLVALCLSIFLEAIQRFVEPQTVRNPKLVLIVGCMGLVSNILGLVLFHDHGGHGHSHGDEHGTAEEGRSQSAEIADESGNIANVLPESVVAGGQLTHDGPNGFVKSGDYDDEEGGTVKIRRPSNVFMKSSPSNRRLSQQHHRHSSSSRGRFASPEDIPTHPASFRNDIIAAGRLDEDSSSPTESDYEEIVRKGGSNDESRPLIDHTSRSLHDHPNNQDRHVSRHESWHTKHKHSGAKSKGDHGGHSHGDLNMRGVFLHVMGDALGNIGVIGSALIIWLTPYWWRFYSDPAISLLITLIILASAIPLCKAASRILLQGVPAGISIKDIKDDIQQLPGIISCHHVHVWQLSDTKLVASLHVQVGFDFKGEGSARYMQLARAIRKCLHAYGIHSSTIQPEFCLDPAKDPTTSRTASRGGSSLRSAAGDHGGGLDDTDETCLLECDDECGGGQQCCAPNGMPAGVQDDHHHLHPSAGGAGLTASHAH